MHVVFHGLFNSLLRSLEKRTYVNVESKIEDEVQDFAQDVWDKGERVRIYLELQRTLGVPEGADAPAS